MTRPTGFALPTPLTPTIRRNSLPTWHLSFLRPVPKLGLFGAAAPQQFEVLGVKCEVRRGEDPPTVLIHLIPDTSNLELLPGLGLFVQPTFNRR